ncbi:hypothetical protein EG327_002594 [Venturia inaequalis]|uniref:Acyltransferase 3 domain-containing protein n=1 Tax=Venturia inaequalis TaxID=5025 RepID=A0A8H3ZAV0_VENIN|nr:hypothetical protein EG327_002594 [Venturia inaequalis]
MSTSNSLLTTSSTEKYDPQPAPSPLTRLPTLLLSLLPKFLKRHGLKRKHALKETAYLDALRGIAALIVINHHHLHPSKHAIFGLFTAGKSSVNVFFVISGFVLSYASLKSARAREEGKLLNGFAGALFRRWMRLFLPSFVATFVALVLVRMGRLPYVARYEFLHQQVWDWMRDCAVLSNPFAGPRGYKIAFNSEFSSRYIDPLWTIPLEFRGSIVLYAVLVGTCKLRAGMRMAVTILLVVGCYIWSSIFVALFLGGMGIAEVNLWRGEREREMGHHLPSSQLQQQEMDSPPSPKSKKERAGWLTLFVTSLFLLNQPDDFPTTTVHPWPYLRSQVPAHLMKEHDQLAQHFWLSIGALLFVLCLDNYPALQKPLRWDISQYLGDVSFGVYVMHVLLMWAWWQPTMLPFWQRHFGQGDFAWWVVWVLYVGLILWVGELFSRIDKKIVGFGKWLQGRLFEW